MDLAHLKLPQVIIPHQQKVPLLELRRTPPPSSTPPRDIKLRLRMPPKQKVVVVMGATGTGKSRLAIDLALSFDGEVINSDKIQIYYGLDVVTNKVTPEECCGIPHHLLGVVDPSTEFSAPDFRREAALTADLIARRGCLPIIAGGSNSFLEELLDGSGCAFRMLHDCCLVWVDVQLPVLHSFVGERVDRMVARGLVEEVRQIFDPRADYTKGIRRAIGVPELDHYLQSEATVHDDECDRLLTAATDEIKANTRKLACRQLGKIRRLCTLPGWHVHRVDATKVFEKKGEAADEAWRQLVAGPSIDIVREFLTEESCKIQRSAGNKRSVVLGGNSSNNSQRKLVALTPVGATL